MPLAYYLVSWLIDPFSTAFVARALVGGVLVAVICGVVGTWVVIRGMAFFGEAIGHGMLPGVALATVLGFPAMAGGAVSAVTMSVAIGALQRRGRLSYDTTIGLLFVTMLSVGVIIVSHSGSFATDATAILFGDILAVGAPELLTLAIDLAVTLALGAGFHRAFVAAAFDPRIAQTLGLRPGVAQVVLVGLVTLAVVASYQAVGTLLVVALLLAPVVAANRWTRRIPSTMALATAFGSAAVVVGPRPVRSTPPARSPASRMRWPWPSGRPILSSRAPTVTVGLVAGAAHRNRTARRSRPSRPSRRAVAAASGSGCDRLPNSRPPGTRGGHLQLSTDGSAAQPAAAPRH